MLLTLLVALVILVLLWWAFTQLRPFIPEPIGTILFVVGVVLAVIWLLSLIGLGPGLNLMIAPFV